MDRRVLPLFLTALLLFGITDDLFASFTADPQDDILAAANNTYLSGRAAHDQLGQQGSSPLPPAGPPAAAVHVPAAVPRPDPPDRLTLLPLTGTDLLYSLMSLQR